jgi:invasion protein IalB
VKVKYLVAVSLVLASFFSWAVTTSDFGSWSLLCNDSSVCTLSQLVAKDKEAKKVLLGVNVDYSYSQDFPVLKIKLPKNTLTKKWCRSKNRRFCIHTSAILRL